MLSSGRNTSTFHRIQRQIYTHYKIKQSISLHSSTTLSQRAFSPNVHRSFSFVAHHVSTVTPTPTATATIPNRGNIITITRTVSPIIPTSTARTTTIRAFYPGTPRMDDNHEDSDTEQRPIPPSSPPKKPNQNRGHKRSSTHYKFVDRARLKLSGGSGGSGCLSYESQKMSAYKKKPDGGHGGNGGFVILVADANEQSLNMQSHHYRAQDGGNGGSKGKAGRNGKDLVIRVPCGVVVRRVLGENERWIETDKVVEKIEGGDDGTDTGSVGDRDVYGSSWERATSIGVHGSKSREAASALGEDDNSDDTVSKNENSNIDNEANLDTIEDEYDLDSDQEHVDYSRRKSRTVQHKKKLPFDYDQVVDTGIRSQEDGLFYFSPYQSTSIDNQNPTTNIEYLSSEYNPNYIEREKITIADLDEPNSYVVAARGGRGGVGNSVYASRRYSPNHKSIAQRRAVAFPGEISHIELELKLIADVGLVGFPNAGKSSLLAALSMARPKIASYPFTTLDPLVGCVEYRDRHRVLVADVPGLIDGASEGRGRGIGFLRHLERTKALLYIVDAAGVDGRCPVEDMGVLVGEIAGYADGDMLGKPALVVANKVDLIDNAEKRNEILLELGCVAENAGIRFDGEVLAISAGVTGEGLGILSRKLRSVVELGEANRLVLQ